MSLSPLVYSALANAAGVSSLVSSRIYPLQLPQTPTMPAISYQRVSNTGQNGSTALRVTRYQINNWGATYAEAAGLATVVKAALEDYSVLGIKMGRVVNEIDDYDPDVEQYRVIVDVMFDTIGD